MVRRSDKPRLDNRPLLGTVDRDLFVAPSIMPTLTAAVERGLNALVLGIPGSGKTTLLRAIQADYNDAERPAVYVDLGPAQTVEQALMVIAEALEQRWQMLGEAFRTRLVPPMTPSSALLALARRLGAAEPSLILVDSPPGEGHSHALFGRLRDELWQQGHQWVVAANDVLRDELTRPPANAFFDVRLDLDPLSPREQKEFLVRRLSGEEGIDIDAMVGQTDGLPRSLLELARTAVLSSKPVQAVLDERERYQRRLDELPPTAAVISRYLVDHGPTSGSDHELLATLGVSGQRARQVLRQLEERGLVRSFPAQELRSGRPRKMYELVQGSDA